MPEDDCPFCRIAADEGEAEVIFSDEVSLAFLDDRPLFHGHSLLIPRDHHETLAELPDGLLAALFANAQLLSRAIPEAMGKPGCFVALNNIVSQSVPHLHVHVVPRKPKDGLRGFFWPRTKYESRAEMARVGDAVRTAVKRSA